MSEASEEVTNIGLGEGWVDVLMRKVGEEVFSYWKLANFRTRRGHDDGSTYGKEDGFARSFRSFQPGQLGKEYV